MTISGQCAPWFGLIGAPADVGNYRCGAAAGPAKLRQSGVVERISSHGSAVVDLGDVTGPAYDGIADDGRCRSLAATAAWCAAVRDSSAQVFRDGGLPLMLGGDHSLVLGTIAAAAANARSLGRPLHLFWFDAHPDFNTPDTTPSGNTHGLPAATACGYGHPLMLAVGAFTPLIDARNVTQFGIRDVDSGERENLIRAGVTFHEMPAVRRQGLVALVTAALESARRQNAVIHVSFDMDGLDPSEAPGVGTPVPGGMTLDETTAALALLGQSGLVGSLDLVEFAPDLDRQDRTAKAALTLLDGLAGGMARAVGTRRRVA